MMNSKILLIFIIFIYLLPLMMTQFTSSDSGPCTCDLTVNQCDLNCCCDNECGNLTDTFTVSCSDQTIQAPSQFCIPTILLFRNNTAFKSKVDGSNTCFYNDSYSLRNYYSNPEMMTSTDQQTANTYLSLKFSLPKTSLADYFSAIRIFSAGDPIFTVYELETNFSKVSIGEFGFPRPTSSGECSSTSTAKYLVSETSRCSRTVTDLPTQCASLPTLSPTFYEAKTALVMAQFNNAFFNAEVLTNRLQFLQINVSTCSPGCNASDLVAPVISGTECQNVVSKVAYEFLINSGGEISSVNLHLTLTNVTTNQKSIQQEFEIYFLTQGQTRPNLNNERSGNPGYLRGKPLLTGTLNSDGSSIVRSTRSVINTPISGSHCGSSLSRKVAAFGVNIRSSCYVEIEATVSSNCSSLNTIVKEALLNSSGLNFEQNSYVAVSADSENSRISQDWVQIFLETSSPNPSPDSQATIGRGCSSIYTGITYTIVYARVGAKSNPQNVVVGAKATIQVGEIKYLCKDYNCKDGGKQKVEIPTVIEYLDATSPLPGNSTATPKFINRSSKNFFYPFYVDNPSATVA